MNLYTTKPYILFCYLVISPIIIVSMEGQKPTSRKFATIYPKQSDTLTRPSVSLLTGLPQRHFGLVCPPNSPAPQSIKKSTSCPQLEAEISTPSSSSSTRARSGSLSDAEIKKVVARAMAQTALDEKRSNERVQTARQKYQVKTAQNSWYQKGGVAGITLATTCLATQAPKIVSTLLAGQGRQSRVFGFDDAFILHGVVSMLPTILTVAGGMYGVYYLDYLIHAEERMNYKELTKSLKKERDERMKADEDMRQDLTKQFGKDLKCLSTRCDQQHEALTGLLQSAQSDISHARTEISGIRPKIELAIANNAETKSFLATKIFPMLGVITTQVTQIREREEKYPDPLDYTLDRIAIPSEKSTSQDSSSSLEQQKGITSRTSVVTQESIEALSALTNATFKKKKKKDASGGISGLAHSLSKSIFGTPTNASKK